MFCVNKYKALYFYEHNFVQLQLYISSLIQHFAFFNIESYNNYEIIFSSRGT